MMDVSQGIDSCHSVLHIHPSLKAKEVSRALTAGRPISMSSPVWSGQILLLLEFLFQAHELKLSEDGATPTGLLLPGRGLLRLRLAAA